MIPFRTIILTGIIVMMSTAGDMAVTLAVRRAGEMRHVSPRAMLLLAGRAFRFGWMWVGIGLMTAGFFSLLVALSWANVSVVVPATAANYALGTLGAKWVLGEQVSRMRWAGVLLVCLGVALVFLR